MTRKEIKVLCHSGLHHRQALLFVQKANAFESNITLESSNWKTNAKSLLGIMTMGIVTGVTVILSADGPDEDAAIDALSVILQRDVQ